MLRLSSFNFQVVVFEFNGLDNDIVIWGYYCDILKFGVIVGIGVIWGYYCGNYGSIYMIATIC